MKAINARAPKKVIEREGQEKTKGLNILYMLVFGKTNKK